MQKSDKKKRRKKKSYGRTILIVLELLAIVTIITVGICLWKYMEKEEPKVQTVQTIVQEIKIESSEEKQMEEILPEDTSRYGKELADEEFCKEKRIYGKETASDEEIVLAFAGDISFAQGYVNMSTLAQRGGDIRDCFDEFMLKEMQGADIFMLNNEFTYSDRGAPTENKTFTFRAYPEHVEYLHDLGVDIVSLANNHSYDYGEVSLLDTLDTLEGALIPYVGAGRNVEEAIKPVYFIANDYKIAFVSATQIEQGDNPDTKGAGENSAGVFRCWNDERICDVVREVKEEADFVIAYIHWGTEMTDELHWAQPDLAGKLVDAGADLIVGDHPHCLQEIAYIGNVPVIYSMGNFWFNSRTQDTGILKVVLDENGMQSLQFVPAIQSNCRTTIAGDADQNRILTYIQSLSPTVKIDASGYITQK